MVSFDIFALIIIGVSILYSVWKGMVREAFSLVALVTAYMLALNLYADCASFIGDVITEETVANILSFIVLFLTGLLFVALLGRVVKKFLHSTHTISGWDRLLGGLFGMVKGVFLVIVCMFPLQWFDETYARWTEDSMVAPYLEEWVDDFRDNIEMDPGFTRTLPGSLKGIRQKIPSIDGLKQRIADRHESLQENLSSLTDADWPPQDDYTEEDREHLDKILNDIADDQN
ncbi:MAG: CvpA family protein [Nitrospina sp.]|nr:MAG: CvpA family protein [Nitrospina sp.]